MQVVSGPFQKPTVHFEDPDAMCLEKEMDKFLTWFRNKDNTDPIIRSGIAHLWFVIIHPF